MGCRDARGVDGLKIPLIGLDADRKGIYSGWIQEDGH